jgi:hypothetical protein
MMKVTRADIRRKVERIVELTGTPIRLEEWSPGDGYTRYRLYDADDRSISHYNRLHEMDEYLNGMIDAIALFRHKDTPSSPTT